jgi:hypothetical protein
LTKVPPGRPAPIVQVGTPFEVEITVMFTAAGKLYGTTAGRGETRAAALATTISGAT